MAKHTIPKPGEFNRPGFGMIILVIKVCMASFTYSTFFLLFNRAKSTSPWYLAGYRNTDKTYTAYP